MATNRRKAQTEVRCAWEQRELTSKGSTTSPVATERCEQASTASTTATVDINCCKPCTCKLSESSRKKTARAHQEREWVQKGHVTEEKACRQQQMHLSKVKEKAKARNKRKARKNQVMNGHLKVRDSNKAHRKEEKKANRLDRSFLERVETRKLIRETEDWRENDDFPDQSTRPIASRKQLTAARSKREVQTRLMMTAIEPNPGMTEKPHFGVVSVNPPLPLTDPPDAMTLCVCVAAPPRYSKKKTGVKGRKVNITVTSFDLTYGEFEFDVYSDQDAEHRINVGQFIVFGLEPTRSQAKTSGGISVTHTRYNVWVVNGSQDLAYLAYVRHCEAVGRKPASIQVLGDAESAGLRPVIQQAVDPEAPIALSTGPVALSATQEVATVQTIVQGVEETRAVVEMRSTAQDDPKVVVFADPPPLSSMPPATAPPEDDFGMDLFFPPTPVGSRPNTPSARSDNGSARSQAAAHPGQPEDAQEDVEEPPRELLGDYLKTTRPVNGCERAAQVFFGRHLTDEREAIAKAVFGSFASVTEARVVTVPLEKQDNRPLSWRGVKRVERPFELRALKTRSVFRLATFLLLVLVMLIPAFVDIVWPALLGKWFVLGIWPAELHLSNNPVWSLFQTMFWLVEVLWPAMVCGVWSSGAAFLSLWLARLIVKPVQSMHPFLTIQWQVVAACFFLRLVPGVGILLPLLVTVIYIFVAFTPLYGDRWITYAPHLVTCLLTEYSRGTSVEVMRATLHARALRLAAFPLPDRFEIGGVRVTATDVLLGTEEVVMYMMQDRYFGSCPPDLHQLGAWDDGQ